MDQHGGCGHRRAGVGKWHPAVETDAIADRQLAGQLRQGSALRPISHQVQFGGHTTLCQCMDGTYQVTKAFVAREPPHPDDAVRRTPFRPEGKRRQVETVIAHPDLPGDLVRQVSEPLQHVPAVEVTARQDPIGVQELRP